MRKSRDLDRGDATETAEGKTAVYQGITFEELGTKWQEAVDELERRGITLTNTKNALEGALSIRYNTNQVGSPTWMEITVDAMRHADISRYNIATAGNSLHRLAKP